MRSLLPLAAVALGALAPVAAAQDGSAIHAGTAIHRAVPAKTTASQPPGSGSAGVLTQPSTAATSVTGPSTPTTNEPGDNQPVLVIAGASVGALALAGAFVIARNRVRDDPR